MAYIQFYKDAACTQLWASVPVVEVPYETLYGNSGTIDGFSYRDDGVLDGVEVIKTNPFLSYARLTDVQRYYCKNGLSIEFGMTATQSVFKNFKYGDTFLSFREMDNSNDDLNHPRYWAIGFVANDGKHYIGFTRVAAVDYFPDYIPISCAFEDSFWTSALRPAYDYGSKPDGDGGQGTGSLDDANITKGQQTGSMPTGGRGLHWYRMPTSGFNSVQNYLWGDVSGNTSIVKSLWQKFQNKTHGPSQCIVGAYKLPSIFMPDRGGASGVQLAGINLPTSNTFATSPGFVYKEINLGTQAPPFGSWLDYQGVTCKIGVPFCGEIACPVEAIWNKKITIRYCCDQHNGNIIATVWAGGHVLGEMSGNVAYQIPIVGGDDGTLARLGALVGTAASAVAAVATDGASLAAGGIVAGASSAAGAQHHTYITNGNLSGGVSACINGVAYIDFIYPSTAYPAESAYADGYGYVASAAHGQVGGFRGGYGQFTVLKHDGGMMIPRATDAEKDEIIRLLETGVIV